MIRDNGVVNIKTCMVTNCAVTVEVASEMFLWKSASGRI